MIKRINIAIVGGGASGMAAAISAAEISDGVCIIEAQQRIGRKLLATGNGRCNYSNTDISASRYHSADMTAVERILGEMPPHNVYGFMQRLGIMPYVEESRIYPRSEQASAILDALRTRIDELGVEVLCGARVRRLKKEGIGFVIEAGEYTIYADRVIIACGSNASPSLGGCTDGVDILRRLGHSVLPMKAALSPIPVASQHLPSLKGVRAKCSVSLSLDGEIIHTESGEVQFNENTLSGIAVFQISSRIVRRNGKMELVIDLLPELSKSELIEMLCQRKNALAKKSCDIFFTGVLHKRIGISIMKDAQIYPLSRCADSLSHKELCKLAELIKSWRFPVSGEGSLKQAQVASGGIDLCEVDGRLHSAKCAGMYICGELLDCDGDCGGFNLHWAWSTGILAGRSAAHDCISRGVKENDFIEQY